MQFAIPSSGNKKGTARHRVTNRALSKTQNHPTSIQLNFLLLALRSCPSTQISWSIDQIGDGKETRGEAMSSNTVELPPSPPEEDISASNVLTNEDLLDNILLRLKCRSCLVSAALTSKRWLRAASGLFIPVSARATSHAYLGSMSPVVMTYLAQSSSRSCNLMSSTMPTLVLATCQCRMFGTAETALSSLSLVVKPCTTLVSLCAPH